MARDYEHANLVQRGIRLAAGTGPGSWVFSRTLDHADRLVFRATKGKHMRAIIGSWYGNAKHPAWRHNLRKHPGGEIEVEGERWGFRAVEVEDERRERIWRKALETHPGFSAYAKRAAPRRISVFVLHRA
jgi:deazaflavin-dependent oxidoreductase (nitroreductase family)